MATDDIKLDKTCSVYTTFNEYNKALFQSLVGLVGLGLFQSLVPMALARLL